jgi:septal ring factor EnvC (AmiA/AmiB activator)
VTHDPLCRYDVVEYACMCPLIARVRADQDRKHWDKTKHLRDRIERLVTKANRWRDENADLRKQLNATSST